MTEESPAEREDLPGSDGEHALQECFGTAARALAFYEDDLHERLTDRMIEFVGERIMFFPATADAEGHTDCSPRIGPAGSSTSSTPRPSRTRSTAATASTPRSGTSARTPRHLPARRLVGHDGRTARQRPGEPARLTVGGDGPDRGRSDEDVGRPRGRRGAHPLCEARSPSSPSRRSIPRGVPTTRTRSRRASLPKTDDPSRAGGIERAKVGGSRPGARPALRPPGPAGVGMSRRFLRGPRN